jgi:hypothetical protein
MELHVLYEKKIHRGNTKERKKKNQGRKAEERGR